MPITPAIPTTGQTVALTGPLQPTPDPLTTLADLKTFLGVTNTTQDGLLNQLIVTASARLTRAMNRTHLLRTNAFGPLTEWYHGTGTMYLVLRQWPVRQVASVFYNGQMFWGQGNTPPVNATLLNPGVDYALRADAPDGVSSMSGILVRLNNVWAEQFVRDVGGLSSFGEPGPGNYQVTYWCGYDAIPDEVAEACRLFIARIRLIREKGVPLTSEHWEQYGYNVEAATEQAWGILAGEMKNRLAAYTVKAVAA